jgi:Flp pilus assembly protein TadG
MFEWSRHAVSSARTAVAPRAGIFPLSGSLPSSHKTRGQALVLVVLAMLLLCLGLIVIFDTGQVVAKKVQLTNTADAAAYSAAVQEARALNLIAYMNRASVANEVAMAQMVSWYSWTNFAISATDHLKDAMEVFSALASFIPGVDAMVPIFLEAINVLQEAKVGLEEGRNGAQVAFKAAATVIAALNGAYSQASQVLGSGMAADAAIVAGNVVTLNDPKASIPAIGLGILAEDTRAANDYVARYAIPNSGGTGDARADRLKNVVMEARDPFSRQRNGTFIGVFKKYGGTDLANYHSWVGVDTLNLEFDVGAPPLDKKYDVPLAWGGGAGVDRATASFSRLARQNSGWLGPYQGSDPQYAARQRYAPYNDALGNGKAGSLVLSQPAEDGDPWIQPYRVRRGATVGLSDYSDIKSDRATVPYENGKNAFANGVGAVDVGPEFTVVVAQPINTVRTSSHVPGIGGPPDFQTKDQAGSDGITAMASAQVYFSRPRVLFPRLTDPGREIGSLFSPYWQARLIATRSAIRLQVAASYGVGVP